MTANVGRTRIARRLRFAGVLLAAGYLAGAPVAGQLALAQEPAVAPVSAGAAAATDDPGRRIVPTAVFNEQKVEMVLTSIANQTGVSITAYGKVPGQRVSIFEKDQELESVLNKIAQPNGWVWFKNDDGSYGVADEAWYKANKLPGMVVTKIFRPDHVSAAELEKAVSPMLTQDISSITADPRTNKLIITDLPEVIAQIERLIREIDVQLFTRVFYIRHADVTEVAEKIESYKSEPGTIEVDEKTHQIIVEDLLANIKKMELLIDILDVGPEIVIYDVNNIGLEGADLEDLQKIIDTIRTPELLFEVNEKQGVFILEDVPEVHDRVEQILATFDQPVKQVLIQGEILTTTFSREFNYGLRNAIYSADSLGLEQVGTGFRDITAKDAYGLLVNETLTGAILNDQALFEWQVSFKDSDTKVLLQPRLLVKNQETSRIFVGSEEPFLTTFFNDNSNNTGTTRSTSQQVVTDGLDFEITPSISNSYLVELEIGIDNDDAQRIPSGNSDTPTLIRRERQSVDTVLTIPSGQTRVIGGLISSSDGKTHSGLPFLSKLPIIGGLFGYKENTHGRSNLQLFLTPTIVEDVIPRPTTETGRRGRLVTGYEKIPGSFDLNQDSQIREEGEEIDLDSLLFDESEGSADQVMEELLREDMPRLQLEEDRDSNYTPRMKGGSGSATPSQSGGTAAPGPAPANPPAESSNGNEGRNRPQPVAPTNSPRPANPDRETRY